MPLPRFILAAIVLATPAGAGGQQPAAPTPLSPGRTVVRTLGPDESHSYALQLDARRWVYLEADQHSADVAIEVRDPAGRRVGSFDQPARGIEPVQFTTDSGGIYRLTIRPASPETGRYALTVRRVEAIATSVDGRMTQLMASYDQPGVAGGVIAVVQGGRLLFARGYGLANLESGAANTPATPMHLASLSKQFTAFAIAMLASEGRLVLDDDVRRWIPELPPYDERLTLRHLLHHTSGLRDDLVLWELAGGTGEDAVGQAEMLRLITRQHRLNFGPGSEYDYTNSGYLLLAEVVARVTGQSFAAWMRHHVFDPVGMTHTFVNDDYGRVIPGRARSYAYSTDGMREQTLTTASTGATGMVSTAEDLVKWLDNWRTARVGGPAVRAMMLQRGVLANGDSIRYALGVNIRTFRGLRRVDHGGYQAGFRTMLVYYPDLEAGIVLLGNTPGFRETALADRVSEIFFESALRPVPLPTATASPAAADRPPTAWQPDSAALSRYAGTYYSPELEAAYTLLVSEGRLWTRHRRHGDIPLVPQARDHFTSPNWMFGRVGFQRDPDGAVIRMLVTPSNERVRDLVFTRTVLPSPRDSLPE